MPKDFIKEYTKLIKEWRSSDLTKAEFCRLNNFSLTTFNKWIRRLNLDDQVSNRKRSSAVKFLPVTIKNDYQENLPSQITIQVKQHLITVTKEVNYANLKAILEIIGSL